MKPLIPPSLLSLDNQMEDFLRSEQWLNRRRGEPSRIVCIDPAERVARHKQMKQEKPISVPDAFSTCSKIVLISWLATFVALGLVAWRAAAGQ